MSVYNRSTVARRWSEQDERDIYDMAKRKASLQELQDRFPNRNLKTLKTKANRMGLNTLNGIIYIKGE